MTLQAFRKKRWYNKSAVRVRGKLYPVRSVDFEKGEVVIKDQKRLKSKMLVIKHTNIEEVI